MSVSYNSLSGEVARRARKQGGYRVTIEVFGIPNCDTVKKARAWLDAEGLEYVFHDYKKEGVDPVRLAAWADAIDWALLLNTRGTSYRQLSETDRTGIDRAKALALMVAQPSLIKRPVVEYGGADTPALLVGFDAGRWSAALG